MTRHPEKPCPPVGPRPSINHASTRRFLEGLADPHTRKRLAAVLATPAALSTRFGLSPCSTRDVLIHGPVAIRHANGRPRVSVREFAAVLSESSSSAPSIRVRWDRAKARPDVPTSGPTRIRFGPGTVSTPTPDLGKPPGAEE